MQFTFPAVSYLCKLALFLMFDVETVLISSFRGIRRRSCRRLEQLGTGDIVLWNLRLFGRLILGLADSAYAGEILWNE